jgi:hypothetical protein
VIAGSLLLILGAVALLVLGLVRGSNPYLVGSIVASLLAAIALVAGSRQTSADRERDEEKPVRGYDDGDLREGPVITVQEGHRRGRRESVTQAFPDLPVRTGAVDGADEPLVQRTTAAVPERAAPVEGAAADLDRGQAGRVAVDEPDDVEDEDPPDEPVAQQVSAAEAARVARRTDDVLVIDGRPRYHLADCAHLLGRDAEPIPVNEAVELGFTPCGLCRPDSALLAQAHPV